MPTEIDRLVAGRYELHELRGRGGMGRVWQGKDSLLQRRVAVKEVEFPAGLSDEERRVAKERVMREARAAARLNHPNVVTVFDVVQDDGKSFIILELLDAPSLADVVERDGPLAPQQAAEMGLEILDALEAAHSHGIVHRDVKPANVMIGSQGVKLGDFGIASVKGDPKLTSSGMILGSPSFMAPEQASRGTSGPESDLWGLGTTLYFALEGKPPFDKGQPIPTLTAVVSEEAPPMRTDGGFEDLVMGLLAKEPEDRPSIATARAALAEIAGTASLGQATTRPVTGPLTAPPREEKPQPEPDPTPGPMPHPEPSPPEPHRVPDRRAIGGWLIALGVAVVIALLAALVLPRLGDEEPGASKPDDRGDRQQRLGAGDDRADVPRGWAEHTDEAVGYTISYPSEWEIVEVDESMTDFRDPASSTYLRVDWTDTPGNSPEGAWESLEQSFAARHADYEGRGITPTTYKGMDAAAWEFEYSEGGARLHAVDLGFVTTDGSYGFALNFQTLDQDWESSQDLFEAFKASFEPPS
jgi:eukaryotic-like serine/threonine-protein kinase